MSLALLPPPLTPLPALDDQLVRAGQAVLDADALSTLAGVSPAELAAWGPAWDRLPPDGYLRDGGRYRRRRHSCFVVDGAQVTQAPHRPHWQPLDYNALHGGIERHFEPMEPAMTGSPAWAALLVALAGRATALRGPQPWHVEAHPFRIDTTDGIGRPTPEGAHRDGVDLVVVILVARERVKGGETRVFDAAGPQGLRFTLSQPWSALLLDDARVVHETTPIQPVDPARPGWRDTLVLTFRAGGFQGPGAP
ncbi:MAG: 2OG-Fe dioxygenase family protein [Aquabacterium sp.]